MTTLYVFGAGGHGREVAELATTALGDDLSVVFVVDDERYLCAPVAGRPVRLLASVEPGPGDRYVVAVGDGEVRERAAAACSATGLRPATLVHPRAVVGRSVELGEGSVVTAGVVITTNVALGRHVHVNVGCTVSHDVVLDDFATLSPGVHVAGHVHVGAGAFLGVGASVSNGRADAPLVIGPRATVGAGACVVSPVEAGSVVVGVPARPLR